MTERKDNQGGLIRVDTKGAGTALDDFFAVARADAPRPGGDFLARMESLALAEQLSSRPEPSSEQPRPQRMGVIRQLREALGGWAGMAGLATACAAGVWIGVSPPDSLMTVFWEADAAGLGTLGVDPLGSFDLPLMEG